MASRGGVLERKYIFEYDVGLWTYGTIQVLRDRKTGDLKTCRTVPKTQRFKSSPRDLMTRLQRLQELRHNHICGVTDVLEDQTRFYIISDKLAGGDVGEWMTRVQEEGNWLLEQTVAEYIRQALIALAFAHSHRVYHRDLRPSSLVLTSKMPDAQVKLVDVGLACLLDPEDGVLQKNPSPYTAPEVSSGNAARSIAPGAADIWSIGAIAHCLLVGQPPSPEDSSWGHASLLLSRRRRDNDNWVDRSPMARDFTQIMLQTNGERPTAASALQHPWLKKAVRLDAEFFITGSDLALDYQNRMMCYMLAVLLLPNALQSRDFQQLTAAFVQLDSDCDGLVARHQAVRLLRDQGHGGEVITWAVDIADVRKCEVIDLCALACSAVLARELSAMEGNNLTKQQVASSLAQQLLRRFFQCYGDSGQLGANAAVVRMKMNSSLMQDLEAHAGVNYQEILASFPDHLYIDNQKLVAELTRNCGAGTPLSTTEVIEHKDLDFWGLDHSIGGLVSSVFHTCGLNHYKQQPGLFMGGLLRNLAREQ